MLRIHSFLQSIYSYLKAVPKRLYRTCAVITAGAMIVSVIALSSNGFGGSGKNRVLVCLAHEMEGDQEEDEEVAADTKAKIQTKSKGIDLEAQLINAVMSGMKGQVSKKKLEVPEVFQAKAEEEAVHAYQTQVSEYEYQILLHIVAAEAGGCDIKGQILVANVIMNRVENKSFPDSVEAVVFQKNQFSPVLAGTLWNSHVTDSVVEAVNRALAGEDYSQGALFFSARARLGDDSMSWFDNNLNWLFEHDGHEFYTLK